MNLYIININLIIIRDRIVLFIKKNIELTFQLVHLTNKISIIYSKLIVKLP